ncbi:hypothetical protein EB796_007893 [Bugula neritina]|uniref:Uncharacterized protein n=1 Tax=Bugula neritina TaxID=10212 RepID=A0A7J7K8B5_BUGNE|nr:hypothetical protein EB796_007893 [Bugula neritina]
MACLKLSSQDIAVSSQVGAGNSDMANESRVSSSTDEHFKSDVQEVYSLVQDMLSNLDTKLHLHSSASPISADYRQSDESSSTGHLPNESSTEVFTNTVLLAKSLEATYPSQTQTSVTSQIQNCESEDSVQQPLARDLAARSFLSLHCDEPPNSNNSSSVENATTLSEICAALVYAV